MQQNQVIMGKPLTCVQCGQSFALDTCLAAHRTIEHLEKPPHRCSICQLAFFSALAYNDHLVRHSLQRPSPHSYFTCSECGLDFPSEHGIRVHISTHTGLSMQSRGQAKVMRRNISHCPYCPAQLVGRRTYHAHVRSHKQHKAQAESETPPPLPLPLPSTTTPLTTGRDAGEKTGDCDDDDGLGVDSVQ